VKILLLLVSSCLLVSAQVKLPHYSRTTLENGVVLQLLPKKDVPMITLSAVIRGGSESDPAGKAGLASVTADSLRRGVKDRTAEQFSEDLDFIGASYLAGVDEQATYITMGFLSKDLDTALDLFAGVIVAPAFPEAEMEKLIQQRIDAARSVKDRPRALTGRYIRPHFFPEGHPYARQVTGDEITLARIEPSDLVDYHGSWYTGRNLIVTAAGDFEEPGMKTRLAGALGALPPGERHMWAGEIPSPVHKEPRLLLVDQPGATQTYFRIAQPGIHRTHPDRVAMNLINTLFGGRFTSMLNDALRVSAGLTYGAFSDMDRNRLQGMLAIESYTATDTTVDAIDLALKVLGELNAKGINEEQLASAKAYVKGRYPTRNLETAGQLAGVLAGLALFDLGDDEVDSYFERIDAVTLEQANSIIQKHYRVENLQFVLVGDASRIEHSVRKYADNMKVVSVTTPGFGSN